MSVTGATNAAELVMTQRLERVQNLVPKGTSTGISVRGPSSSRCAGAWSPYAFRTKSVPSTAGT